ncbi:MAG: Uma2 family endonuclease [Planctomycetia bacterium]|nr:Uma2 family endonuclease [Planctomycetia bacterium]
MSTASVVKKNDYPTTDGRPMAETDIHRDDMHDLIGSLKNFFAFDPLVYVSGNLLLYYVPGNKRKHVSPDVFVVKGVEKRLRDNYLLWEEGKGPDAAIELTSSSTRAEDTKKKFLLYQDVLKVPEYFLFDPKDDYLDPPLQGYRLVKGKYAPIRPVLGRLPSTVLGLHLERHGHELRLFDPRNNRWLPTPAEAAKLAAADLRESEIIRLKQEAEIAKLRLENELLKRGSAPHS